MIDYEKLERLSGKELETYLDELIKFWEDRLQKMKNIVNERKLTVAPECQHEPQLGGYLFTNEGGYFRMEKCIKCGEFYK